MKSKAKDLTCIVCPIGCSLHIEQVDGGWQVSGNQCARGKKYAFEEMIAPKRVLTTTVKLVGGTYPVVAVKTAHAVPKEKIFAIMELLSKVELEAPVHIGDVVVRDVLGAGVNVVVTAERKM
jgi:CxxC motif-containing protein